MTQRAALVAVIGIAIGCNSGSSVTVTQLAVGSAECPNGGVQIKVGGGQPQNVCNGTNGASGTQTLVNTTQLPNGDTNCPAGGVKIDSGLDNGAGGGTANDGKLQDGEILATDIICNGDTGARIGSLTPPSGPAGAYTINANGGDADGGQGGDAGVVTVSLSAASNGGHVKVFRTGVADATFTFPPDPTPTQGAHPVTLTADENIPAEGTATPGLAAGALYTYNGALYQDPGSSGTGQVVTSLTVTSGVTATFAMAGCSGGNVTVNIDGSVVNKGTITTGTYTLCTAPAQSATVVVTPQPHGSLTLTCGDYFGASGSVVTTAGTPGDASTGGGNAGSISITTGSFWNKGLFDASGGVGGSGTTFQPAGEGGQIYVGSIGPIFNTGNMKSTGGTSLNAASYGGNGQPIYLISMADVSNSGNLDASGGTGTTGGNAGAIFVNAGAGGLGLAPQRTANLPSGVRAGSLRNSGNLTAHGADMIAGCDPNAVTCEGGAGNTITIEAYNGLLTSSGNLIASAGNSGLGAGFGGGQIQVEVAAGGVQQNPVLPGNLTLSGNLDASGGKGELAGGNAGSVSVTLDTDVQPNGQEIILLGYTAINANGGNSNTGNAGWGNTINLTNGIGRYAGSMQVPGGSVVNYADLSARGGTSNTSLGGNGSNVYLQTQATDWFPGAQFEMALNAAAIDVSGGDGGGTGSPAGSVVLMGRDGAKNTGNITGKGGSGIGANASAGSGGSVSISSPNGQVNNSGNINLSGGTCHGDASHGDGGSIFLTGYGTVESGNLSVQGGNATNGANGGNGGTITVATFTGLSTINAAAPGGMVVSGGTGSTNGQPGQITVDGRLVTEQWTH